MLASALRLRLCRQALAAALMMLLAGTTGCGLFRPRSGFALGRPSNNRDWQPSLAAVAVPMKSTLNGMALAFNLTVPAHATGRRQLERSLGPKLVGLVRDIEYKLGVIEQ